MSIAALRRWSRSSSARFALLFLLLFGSASATLFAFVYYRSIAYFDAQTDEWLARETGRALDPAVDRTSLIKRVETHNIHDLTHQRGFALFDAHGRRLSGDILALPPGITAGEPVELTAPTTRGPAPLRLMIRVIDNGDRFVATQDLRQTQAY
ncbi:MAG: sensor histidine kinase, partial [Sphingomonas sp.]